MPKIHNNTIIISNISTKSFTKNFKISSNAQQNQIMFLKFYGQCPVSSIKSWASVLYLITIKNDHENNKKLSTNLFLLTPHGSRFITT